MDFRPTAEIMARGASQLWRKRLLVEHLESADIRYEHLRVLGNPKDNRAGFAGDADELDAALARYTTLLTDADAVAALGRVTELAVSNRVALLCFEASDHRCPYQPLNRGASNGVRSAPNMSIWLT